MKIANEFPLVGPQAVCIYIYAFFIAGLPRFLEMLDTFERFGFITLCLQVLPWGIDFSVKLSLSS